MHITRDSRTRVDEKAILVLNVCLKTVVSMFSLLLI